MTKFLRLTKDKLSGNIITDFTGLESKFYSNKKENNNTDKKKGQQFFVQELIAQEQQHTLVTINKELEEIKKLNLSKTQVY